MILPRLSGFRSILGVQGTLWPGRVGGGTAGRVVVLLIVPLPHLSLLRNIVFTVALAWLASLLALLCPGRASGALLPLSVFHFLSSFVINSGGIVPASTRQCDGRGYTGTGDISRRSTKRTIINCEGKQV